MNVIVIWQSLVVSAYRSFWIHLADKLSGTMTAIVPHEFWELGGQTVPCADFSPSWNSKIQTHVLRVYAPHIQMVWFKGLASVFRRLPRSNDSHKSSTLLLALMEPYSLSALFVYFLAQLFLPRKTQILFYSLQNIYKEFPLPLKMIQNFIFKRSPNILALSEEVTGVLRKQGYTGRIIRFPLWADSSLFHQKDKTQLDAAFTSSQDRVRVGYCGAVTESKGVPDLLTALESFTPEELSSIHFEMAGGGPIFDDAKLRLEALSTQGLTFKLHGPVPATALPDFFNSLDVLVVPSRTETHWKEQFGRVIVEAWACGALVIGSNSGEIPVLLRDPELIFEERNPASLAESLKKVVTLERSPASREASAQRAQPYLDVNIAERFASDMLKYL